MPDEGIPVLARQFIREYIQSVEQLEILLLLRGSSARAWTAKTVFDVIRSSERSVSDRLAQFVERGLLTSNGGEPATFRYSPGKPELARMVDETASAYQTHRVIVIETIFKPEADPAQTFADAFKLKRH